MVEADKAIDCFRAAIKDLYRIAGKQYPDFWIETQVLM